MKLVNNRDEIINNNRIEDVVRSHGIELTPKGEDLFGICPFHKEKSASFSVTPSKDVFYCFGCGENGSVIDFVSKIEGLTISETMKKLGGKLQEEPKKELKIVAQYEYQDEKGEILYKVIRYSPKTFRQCRKSDGKICWNLDGVRRVLYRLPEITKAQEVIITEGEKDVQTLVALGFQATTNAGGANKWLDAYTSTLIGKDVVILPDNDEAGKKHAEKLLESLAGKTRSVKVIGVPSEFKDVSDWVSGTKLDHKGEIRNRIEQANNCGVELPIYSIQELEVKYREFVKTSEKHVLNFDWLPSLKKHCRGLVPGELMAILADTGVGKTAIIQNIAFHAAPLKVLLFELELADSLIFERFTQIRYKTDGQTVENAYKNDVKLEQDEKLNHIFTCPMSKQTPETIEKYINLSELKLGEKPNVVIIDYVGLVQGEGKSRYEKLSMVAEEIKRIAKATNTIIIIASQIHRKGEDADEEIYLHDAKDSGSIENSSGLILGAWRESDTRMILKILKNTKGSNGWKIPCNFEGRTLRITEMKEDARTPYGN